MNKVVRSEILDIAQYERVRAEFRARIIALKKKRRLAVGPTITMVFENHETVLSQIQEMMRAERIVNDEAIDHEIATYNELLPDEGQLAATMFIELNDANRIREGIARFHGLNTGEITGLRIGADLLPGIFVAGQSDDRRISAVQYVRFQFNDAQRAAFLEETAEARLMIDHPNYRHSAIIDGELRRELARDFSI
ncbi:MAG TPA: DUF3501 family protein [Blastocatellia bacterium]|nr:DUF3501 family protein [Blastocatellia bacterium]